MKKIYLLTFTLLLTSVLFLPIGTATAKLKATLEGHTDIVWSVAFSPNGKTLASGSWDQTVRLWDVDTEQLLHTFRDHTDTVNSVAFSLDGQTLASGSWDGTIRLWNPRTGQLKRTLTDHRGGVSSIAFSPDGQTLASGSADQTIHLWNTTTWQLKRTLTGHTHVVDSVAFSPDSNMLASGSRDQTIRLWNPNNGNLKRTLTGHTGDISRMMFSPDGSTLASASPDGTVRLWNPHNRKLKRTLAVQTGWTRPVAFSPDGATLLIGGHGISVWDTETDQYKIPLTTDVGDAVSIVFSPDGQMVASGSADNKIRLWEFTASDYEIPSVTTKGMVRLVYFLPNDRMPDPKIDVKMDTLIKEVQQHYAELMENYGSGGKTFPIETDTLGNAVVHHIDGEFADAYYFDETVGKVLKEVRKQFDTSKSIYFIAINSDYHLTQRTAWGNFDGIGGWTLVPTTGIGFGVGVAAHELGHAFGLSHDYRQDAKLIPSSYSSDQMITSFCAAEWLDVHRYFNAGQQNQDVSRTQVEMLPPTFVSEPNTVRFRFEVTDLDGLHQAQLLIPEGTYSGGLIACKSLNGTSSVVEFTTTELAPEIDWVTLRVIDVHGNFTSHRFPIDIISLLPPSKVISIPDVNLAAAVRETLNLDPGTVLTSHKMLELTHLNAPDRQITDLTGLEHALNLRELWLGIASFQPDPNKYISSNAISDLSPIERLPKLYWMMLANPSEAAVATLPRLTQLRYLQIYNPPIPNVSVISKLTQLRVLQIYNSSTPDVSAFVSALAGLTQLRTLALTGISMSNVDVSVLAGLTQLKSLHIEGNSISDVSPLSKLIQLEQLDIWNTSVSDVSALSELTQLRVLQLHNSPISDISGLAGLTQLGYLQILDTSVSDISPLGELTQLGGLKLGNSPISDVSPLTGFTQLVELGLWNTFVSDISSLVELTQLTWLNLNGSPLSYPSIHTYIPAIQARVEWVHFDNVAHPALLKVSGDAQEDASGAVLAIPFVVEAIDANGKPMQGVLVTFAVTEGSGKLSATTTTTDSAGKAQTTLQLGRNPGKHIVTATATEITPSVLTFTAVAVGETVRIAEDVNGDGTVNIQDLVFVASNLGETGENIADVNGDGIVNIIDLLKVASEIGAGAAAPSAYPQALEILTATDVRQWLTQAQQLDLTDATFQRGILLLEQLLAVLIPKETSLLPNYPNPFNPETWIPYQLSEPAEVTLHIYVVDGRLIRTLALGHQLAGMYHSKSRAAYWDGKNTVGEPVASGIYFYRLIAGDFSATRKMLIQK